MVTMNRCLPRSLASLSIGAVRIKTSLPLPGSESRRRLYWNGRLEISKRLRVVCGTGALPAADLLANASDVAASLKGGLGDAAGGLHATFEEAQAIFLESVGAWNYAVREGSLDFWQGAASATEADLAAALAAASSPSITTTLALAATLIAAIAVWDLMLNSTLPVVEENARSEPTYQGLPYPMERCSYDPVAARTFFQNRPTVVLRRSLELWKACNALVLGLLFDSKTGQLEKNEQMRAKGILAVVTSLGPTFIKIGQTLSIRPDIIPQAYANELAQLQDQVPAFSSEQAREVLMKELRLPDAEGSLVGPGGVFRSLSPHPVAAASIGCVFKGQLADGRHVAVKVQRPDAFSRIALDLFLVRVGLALRSRARGEEADFALVDEWGAGFLNECDYLAEAANTQNFVQAMRARGLAAVTSPVVVPELSTRQVLVSEWIDGARLDQSDAADVPRLCSVALNAYLTMLLDTGCLHCDPHPGNLLRTDDGKLCILDWGMTQEVDTDIQYALVEYIAHINSKNYAEIPQDFVNMGFLRADKVDEVRRSGMLEPLTYMLEQLAEGGGPKKVRERIYNEYRARYPDLEDKELRVEMRREMRARVVSARRASGLDDISIEDLEGAVDVSGVTRKFEQMQKENAANFSLPPYFVYITRAFATLEGIGLSIDPEFAIVKECWPYLAKRLLSDPSPRAEAALRSILYGATSSAAAPSTADPGQFAELVGGFASYTATTSAPQGAQSNQGMKAAATAAAELVLSEDETLLQCLIVKEAASVAAAMARSSARDLLETRRLVRDNLGPLGWIVLPDLPQEIVAFTKPTQRDEQALRLAAAAIQAGSNASYAISGASQMPAGNDNFGSSPLEVLQTAQEVFPTIQNVLPPLEPLLPGSVALGQRFGAALLKQTADDIEEVLSTQELDGFAWPFVQNVAQGTADAARQAEQQIRGLTSQASTLNRLSGGRD